MARGCLSFHAPHSQGLCTDHPIFVFHLGCCTMVWVGCLLFANKSCLRQLLLRPPLRLCFTSMLPCSSMLTLKNIFSGAKIMLLPALKSARGESWEEGIQDHLCRICHWRLHNCSAEILSLLRRSRGKMQNMLNTLSVRVTFSPDPHTQFVPWSMKFD